MYQKSLGMDALVVRERLRIFLEAHEDGVSEMICSLTDA